MHTKLIIRDEISFDQEPIFKLTLAAFETLEISNHTEQLIIDELRNAGALTVSLVAEYDSVIVGHIAFSPVTVSDGTTGWYGLGPVSVLPEHQRKGIGKQLIEAGLNRLKAIHAKGCCLVGHPGYYGRFGFTNPSTLTLEGVPAEVFFALPFVGPIPKGKVAFHEAFLKDYHT